MPIGGKSVTFLNYPDGLLEITMEIKKEVVKAIRKVKPDVVITMDPSVIYSAKRGMINHPDHRAAGQICLDAIYPLARDHLSFPELLKEGYKPHKTKTVLLTNFNEHNYLVNIDSTIDKKIAAIMAHKSQFEDPAAVGQWFKKIAKDTAKNVHFNYAEAFMRIDLFR